MTSTIIPVETKQPSANQVGEQKKDAGRASSYEDFFTVAHGPREQVGKAQQEMFGELERLLALS